MRNESRGVRRTEGFGAVPAGRRARWARAHPPRGQRYRRSYQTPTPARRSGTRAANAGLSRVRSRARRSRRTCPGSAFREAARAEAEDPVRRSVFRARTRRVGQRLRDYGVELPKDPFVQRGRQRLVERDRKARLASDACVSLNGRPELRPAGEQLGGEFIEILFLGRSTVLPKKTQFKQIPCPPGRSPSVADRRETSAPVCIASRIEPAPLRGVQQPRVCPEYQARDLCMNAALQPQARIRLLGNDVHCRRAAIVGPSEGQPTDLEIAQHDDAPDISPQGQRSVLLNCALDQSSHRFPLCRWNQAGPRRLPVGEDETNLAEVDRNVAAVLVRRLARRELRPGWFAGGRFDGAVPTNGSCVGVVDAAGRRTRPTRTRQQETGQGAAGQQRGSPGDDGLPSIARAGTPGAEVVGGHAPRLAHGAWTAAQRPPRSSRLPVRSARKKNPARA